MITAVYFFALVLGLGAWLAPPTPDRASWHGFTFYLGSLILILALYAANVVFGIPLSRLLTILALCSVTGLGWRYYRNRFVLSGIPRRLTHPIWVLTALGLGVAWAHGGIEYLPYPGDEVASWLKLARQIFLVDAYWSEKVDYHLGAYSNGWPLLVAFSNTIHGFYDESHAALVQFVFHVGLLGATYDATRFIVQRNEPAGRYTADLVGWLTVVGLLTIEASWILFPTFQLIEKPLLYAVLGVFVIGILGLYDTERRLVALYVGIALATAYLMKLAALAVMPAALFLAIGFLQPEFRRKDAALLVKGAEFGALILAPFLFVAISWGFFKIGSNCTASPIRLLTEQTGPAFEQPLRIFSLYVDGAVRYLMSYKLPITLVTGLFLLTGLFDRRARWLVGAYVVFAVLYGFALYVAYLTCIDVLDLGGFEGQQRYLRIILRLIHFLGPLAFLMWAMETARLRSLIAVAMSRRAFSGAAALLVALSLLWQVRSLDIAIEDMRSRVHQDPKIRAAILRMNSESRELARHVQSRGLVEPNVSMIAQGGYNVEIELGTYFGIKSRADGGSNFYYRLSRPYAWSDVPKPFSQLTTHDELERWWRRFDVVWPVITDAWTRKVLARLVTDPECGAQPENFFFFRTVGGFECVRKHG